MRLQNDRAEQKKVVLQESTAALAPTMSCANASTLRKNRSVRRSETQAHPNPTAIGRSLEMQRSRHPEHILPHLSLASILQSGTLQNPFIPAHFSSPHTLHQAEALPPHTLKSTPGRPTPLLSPPGSPLPRLPLSITTRHRHRPPSPKAKARQRSAQGRGGECSTR